MKKLLFTLLTMQRRVGYISLALLDNVVLRRKNKLVILCYHSVSNDSWRFGVAFSTLKKQILSLKEAGFAFLTLDDVSRVIAGKKQLEKPSVVITFDDGYKDILQTRTFFKKLGIQPTLFILADPKRANRTELATDRAFLSKKDILDLKRDGWTIGCHTATHADLSIIHPKQAEEEIVDAKRKIERELKIAIQYLAYPKGRYTENVLSLVKKAKYTLGLTMDDGFVTSKTHVYKVPRVGVDRTHTLREFQAAFSPSVIQARGFIKQKMGVIL